MWRGAIPTMGRAMVVNAAQLASYSQAKQLILQTGTSNLVVLDNQLILFSLRDKFFYIFN